MYILCNHENNVPFLLSLQWLCSNSCTWVDEVRLPQNHHISCAQMLKSPQGHCDDNREGKLLSWSHTYYDHHWAICVLWITLKTIFILHISHLYYHLYLSILSICLSIYIFIYISITISISIYLSIYLSIYIYIYIYVYIVYIYIISDQILLSKKPIGEELSKQPCQFLEVILKTMFDQL